MKLMSVLRGERSTNGDGRAEREPQDIEREPQDISTREARETREAEPPKGPMALP
ncbi:MAG: hypothetical protein JO363_20830, partial [Solirubrobacterales bacterium]|nr:hypothetical protein [Solirubrobacterales bacterium]